FFLRGFVVDGEGVVPVLLGDFEFLALVVEAKESSWSHGIDCAFGGAEGAGATLANEVLAGEEFSIATEKDVGAAACHVGCDGDHTSASGLGNEFSFALVLLGVEDDVADAFALENGERRSDFSMETVPTRTG